MLPELVEVVCVLVGDRYPDYYVAKLQAMLDRHMGVPYRLTCVIDRPRRIPSTVEVIDASQWGMRREKMRVTTNKLRLFDDSVVPLEEFLYLDLTLVIQKDMRPLLEFAFSRAEELVVLQDWNYDCYNSCVMRIRPGGALKAVYESFASGKEYPRRNPGDQDFLFACVKDLELERHVALFPEGMAASYRDARRLNRTDPDAAYAKLGEAIIVKFFGRGKPHQILNPIYNLFKIRLREFPASWPDGGFWIEQLRESWERS